MAELEIGCAIGVGLEIVDVVIGIEIFGGVVANGAVVRVIYDGGVVIDV